MLPEYEVEMVTAMLSELRRQVAADVQASVIQAVAQRSPSLTERLYSVFRFDVIQAPACQQAVLPMQYHPSR